MKCHFTSDGSGNQFLIPGCWPVVLSGEVEDCTCKKFSYPELEKELYNERMRKAAQEVKELTQEVLRLNRIIRRLTKKTASQLREAAEL